MIAEGLPPAEIDARVREVTARGESLYRLDEATLATLEPDLIVTQALCAVCAVSFDDVRAVAGRLPSRPRVISLDPENLDEVLGDIDPARRGDRQPAARRAAAEASCAAASPPSPRRSPAPSARGSRRSSGSTRSTSAATGCRR